MNETLDWVQRCGAWLCETRKAVAVVAIIPLSVLIAWAIFPAWEPRIRLAGLFLQLAGLATVAWGLRETRKLFRRRSLVEDAMEWARRRPRRKLAVFAFVGSGSVRLRGLSATAYGTTFARADASLADRVSMLEQALQSQRALIDEHRARIDEETSARGEQFASERNERKSEDERTQQLLENTVAGGLRLEVAGVFWLLFGIVLGTAAPEIAKLLSH